MKRRSLLQGAAAVALGAPALVGLAQQSVTLKFHTFMAPQSQRLADDAQAVDGEGREGIRRPHQVRGLPGDAARRHAGAALRPGARRRRRRRLDAARQHRRALPADRGVRAAVHHDQRRGDVEGVLGVHPDAGARRVQGDAGDRAARARPGHVPFGDQADQVAGRPEGHEGARPDAPGHQAARRARRDAGRHAAAADPRRALQGHDRRLRDPVGSRAFGQGPRADQVPHRVPGERPGALHDDVRDGDEQGRSTRAWRPT